MGDDSANERARRRRLVGAELLAKRDLRVLHREGTL